MGKDDHLLLRKCFYQTLTTLLSTALLKKDIELKKTTQCILYSSSLNKIFFFIIK